ncbi:MAG TPA: DUF5069 domain-containing protein [Nitrospirales bacterium]|nr:DUF5069 domain-containing protein [Nitrospirales bacterium]
MSPPIVSVWQNSSVRALSRIKGDWITPQSGSPSFAATSNATMFFDFKGIAPDMFRARIAEGLTDDEIQAWTNTTGTLRTEDEILAWSYDCRWNAPATTELKAFIERNAREISPNYLYIRSLFELIDIEEGQFTLTAR